ncbi:hypothetical protein QN277_023675 [Acacia crassicarpa]|uniref:PGG domain-containing protein n=1 Tax=Acacia crassicarpa TaxID=499986 RepID=A0AAE1MN91_9FABA|nr:hypothetical protein QN277_023675 [Acacia crassicarpa]
MEEYESNKKKLFSCAMKGEWNNVIKLYKDDRNLHKARITRSGQTALHIAVSDGKENEVKQMLQVMSQKDQPELVRALRTQNHRGNTALHLAASMGNATICRIIASVEATLVDVRNDDGETPLFLAALHGRKQAFLCLHSIRNPNITPTTPPVYVNCRRKNGDTILHCAINGDYFDLAFQIIHLYEDLATRVNEEGLSPLHLLASKPSAFKSGSRLGRIETIIYHCIYVEKLKAENPAHEHQTRPISVTDSDSHDCPDNYNILWNVFSLIRKVVTAARKPDAESDAEDPRTGGSPVDGGRPNPLFPVNYATCCNLIRFFYLVLMTVLGKGSEQLRNIYRKKETHTWSVQIVKELLQRAAFYEYLDNGGEPQEDEGFHRTTSFQDLSVKPGSTKVKENEEIPKICTKGTPILVAARTAVNKETMEKIVELLAIDKEDEQLPKRRETPILVAAKNGVMEIIKKIVELFPVAIQDMNEEKKNIVLLAVEHRQPHVFEFLMEKNIYRESLFHQVDKDGNSALHLAATLGDYKPWLIPGEALQMQWEHKWYKFVKEAMPPDFFGRYNNKNETSDAVFTKTHKNLTKSAAEWLNKTSESCSVVAALIATVAFATAATVPGGVKQDSGQDSGHPILEDEPEFQVFAIASLVALGFSITAMVMFLSILTSRFQEQDFNKNLPRKLLVGLTSLFMSIASMLVSFCAGHFFVLKDELHYLALPIYVATCLPVTLFVLGQFPLYFDLLWATSTHVPQRSYRPT